MDIDELRLQHEDIALTAGKLAMAVTNADVPQGVGALRWQLARKLMAHLALEDRILYPSMLRLPDEQARAACARLHAETGTLAEQFTRYMALWSDDRIAREWRPFYDETRRILAALSDRIDREERTLYPLAESATDQPGRVARTG